MSPARLTQEQVDEMRAMHATGRVTQSGLAKHFKVHPMTVNSIINNRSWMTEEES